jgi:simple sugar transport system permease protein
VLLNTSAAAAATASPAAAFFILCLAALAAVITGGAIGAASGLLKYYTGANEIITSFLLAAALNPVADYFITGPLRDSSGSLLASKTLPAALTLPHILPPSTLSPSFFAALAAPVILFFIINKTKTGYRYRIAGASPDFARYGGIESEKYWTPSMAASGALAALAGFFAVSGTYGIIHKGFSGGIGWAGIAVALIAKSRPLAILPAAFFYAYLYSGANSALLSSGANFDTTLLIQGIVLAVATIKFVKKPRSN